MNDSECNPCWTKVSEISFLKLRRSAAVPLWQKDQWVGIVFSHASWSASDQKCHVLLLPQPLPLFTFERDVCTQEAADEPQMLCGSVTLAVAENEFDPVETDKCSCLMVHSSYRAACKARNTLLCARVGQQVVSYVSTVELSISSILKATSSSQFV